MESTGSSAFNPATDVNLELQSFELSDQEGLEPILPYTIFYDFYRGLEPLSTGEDQGLAKEVRSHLGLFLGITPSDDEKTYISVRNPLDLLHEIIREDSVETFKEARRLMKDSLLRGEAATYNTPDRNALIRFVSVNEEHIQPASDKDWRYPMLDWTSNPTLNKVFRATQFVATHNKDDEAEELPELASAAWSGRFSDAFGASGFNQPEFAATSLTGRTLGTVELLQEFTGRQVDTLSLRGASGITFQGSEPDCLRIIIDYGIPEVTVFTSQGETPIVTGDDGTSSPNPNHCGNKQRSQEALTYNSVPITNR